MCNDPNSHFQDVFLMFADRVCHQQGISLWVPFQNAATAVTNLYKGIFVFVSLRCMMSIHRIHIVCFAYPAWSFTTVNMYSSCD